MNPASAARRLSPAVAGVALALLAATPVAAQADDCDRPSAPLVRSLVGWIGAHTDYDVSGSLADPPPIRFCERGEEIPYAGSTILVEPGERAFYDFRSRQIHLVEPWRETEPRDVGVLLHELIHDVQFLNRGWECPNASEWEAHKLHALWLEQQGIEPGFNWLRIYFRARCPRDIHP